MNTIRGVYPPKTFEQVPLPVLSFPIPSPVSP